MIRLTETEIQMLRSMREQARAGVIGYWQIYQHLADLLRAQAEQGGESVECVA